MPPETDIDGRPRNRTAEHALSDRSAIERWAAAAGKRPAVAATPGGSLRLDFVREADESRTVDWDVFFTLYDDADVALLVNRRSDGHRFVDDERVGGRDGRADGRPPDGR